MQENGDGNRNTDRCNAALGYPFVLPPRYLAILDS